MPRCLKCGNSTHFNCNHMPKSTAWNTGISSGLVGLFNEGTLINMENNGVSSEDLNNAWLNPHLYFNSCSLCGSDHIVWP